MQAKTSMANPFGDWYAIAATSVLKLLLLLGPERQNHVGAAGGLGLEIRGTESVAQRSTQHGVICIFAAIIKKARTIATMGLAA
jgi:hypothetical protein